MSTSPQRSHYHEAQAQAVHRNLRFLEAVVTSPIGLTTDLRSLREAMPVSGADEERDRQAFHDLTSAGKHPRQAAMTAGRIVIDTLDLLDQVAAHGEHPLPGEWRSCASKVLDRVLERLGADVRRETAQAMAGIYVIVDPEHTNHRSAEQIAEAAIKGGAAAIQLRDKQADKGPLLKAARSVMALCESHGVVFLVNDHADVARLANSDGLHVGQNDLPVREARRVLSPHQVVGTSNALVQEALDSEAATADYIAVGAIFPTSTKGNTRPAGLETLRQVRRSVATPLIAIGGINQGNVAEVAEAGADAACVATAVTMAEDPEEATRQLADRFENARRS